MTSLMPPVASCARRKRSPLMISMLLADALQHLAQTEVDQGVSPTQQGRRHDRDERIDEQQEPHDRERQQQAGEQPEAGNDDPAHHLVDLVQHALADLGAVVLEKPSIGLAQIGLQQPGRDRVAPHRGEADDGPGSQGLEHEAGHDRHEDADRQEYLEGEGAGEAEGLVGPGEMAAFGDLLGLGQDAQKQHDGRDAQNLGEGDDDHQHHKQIEPTPFVPVEEIQYLAVHTDHAVIPFRATSLAARLAGLLLAETNAEDTGREPDEATDGRFRRPSVIY